MKRWYQSCLRISAPASAWSPKEKAKPVESPIYIIRLYLPPEETVGRYGVGQQTGSIYVQGKTGAYTLLSQ